MKKVYPFLVLVAVFGLVGYMESPKMHPEDHFQTPVSTEESEKEAVAGQGTGEPSTTMELELVHEGTKVVDGAKVEAYREYEIYKDSDGNIIEEVSTEHYNYLRYK